MANILGKQTRDSSDDEIELKRIFKDIPEDTLKDLNASEQRCASVYSSLKLSGEDVSGFNIKLPICNQSSIVYDDGEPSSSVYPPHMVIMDSSESISPILSDTPEGLVVYDGIRYVCYDALRAKMVPEHQIILDTYIDMENTKDFPIKPKSRLDQDTSTYKDIEFKDEVKRKPGVRELAMKVYQEPRMEKIQEKKDSGISSNKPPTEIQEEKIDYNTLPKTHVLVFNKRREEGKISLSVPRELTIGFSKSKKHSMEMHLYDKLKTLDSFKKHGDRLLLTPFYVKRKK